MVTPSGLGPARPRDGVARLVLNEGTNSRGVPIVPDHELLRSIGAGSYGEVWLARSAVGTLRAIKIVYRKTFWHDHPFEREFKGIQKFEPISRSHEGMVDILQIGRGDGYFYYVMGLADDAERSAGVMENWSDERTLTTQHSNSPSRHPPTSYAPRTLQSELTRRGRLPVSDCVQIGMSLTSALGHLHQNGLVHRDVKPGNVIFVDGIPKLADIGLVAEVAEARSYVGTEGFIPPEGPGSPQADLYSLGKLLYEISTGKDRHAFPELPADLAEQSEAQQLVELNAVLLKACQNDVRQRYQSAAQMSAEMELLRRGSSVQGQRRRQARWAFTKRSMGLLAVFAVLATASFMLVREFKRARSARGSNPAISLGRMDEGPPSTNELANQLYAQGMLLMRADDSEKLGQAYTNFVDATRLDANFASAHAALFEMHFRETFSGMPLITHEGLQELTAKLVELAPSMAATHVAVSCMQYFDWKYAQAKKSCEEAIRVNPNYEFAHTHYGWILILMGDWKEGRKQLWEAAKLEPSKAVVRSLVGRAYYAERDYPRAIEQYRYAIRSKPDYFGAHQNIGRALMAMGQYQEAIHWFEKADILDGGDPAKTKGSFDELRRAFEEGGEKAYWSKMLERTQNTEFYSKAVAQIHLGHAEAAFDWLTKSYETREKAGEKFHQMDFLLFDEDWDAVRENPRFKALLRKVGYPNQ